MLRKRSFLKLIMTAVAFMSLAFLFPQDQAVAKTVYLRLSTGTPGGTYFPMGGGLASLISKQTEGVKVVAEGTSGSAENVRLMEGDLTDLAWINSSEMYWGWNGLEYFKDKKYQKMRAVTRAWTNHYHWFSIKKRGIKDIMDVKGKRVCVGTQGSGAALHGESLLRTLGLWDKIDIKWLPMRPAANALMDGQLDVFGCFSGMPMAVLLEIQALHDVTLIDVVDEAKAAGFSKKYPFYKAGVIPAGTYKGQDKEVGIYQQSTFLLAHEKLSEDMIYNILSTLYSDQGLSYMKKVHARGAELKVKTALDGIEIIPMHPGAIRFFKEKGLEIPPPNF